MGNRWGGFNRCLLVQCTVRLVHWCSPGVVVGGLGLLSGSGGSRTCGAGIGLMGSAVTKARMEPSRESSPVFVR